MNIYTATLIHKNYGSMLQAYALQNCLRSNGATPYIILEKDGANRSKLRRFISGLLSDIIYILKPDKDYSLTLRLKLVIDDYKFSEKYKKMNSFIKDKLTIINILNEDEFLRTIPPDSLFLAGSDQVWNSPSKLPWYAFQWVKNNSNKYSYAASVALSSMNNEQQKVYIEFLSSFKTISLREEQSVTFFKPIFANKVRHDLDPTLLYDKSFWRRIESPRLISEPYIFVYRLRPNKDVFDLARRVAKERKCKIVYTGSYACHANDIHTIYNAGAEDFLSYIDHAEAIVTNSFHGTAFSIIYEKQFLSVKVATTGSRAESLLTILDLKSQFIVDPNGDYSLKVDYTKVNDVLKQEREKSLEYLNNICSN